VTADRRQLQRRENHVQVRQRPPAHQRQGAVGLVQQHRQGFAQRRWNEHLARRGGKIEQRAVDVKQYGDFAKIDGCGQQVRHAKALYSKSMPRPAR
jgi:hypothetical protein